MEMESTRGGMEGIGEVLKTRVDVGSPLGAVCEVEREDGR